MVLYKILYFIDFDYYEKYEEQLVGAKRSGPQKQDSVLSVFLQ